MLKFEASNSGGIPDSVLLTGLPANHDASDFTGSDKVFAVYVAGEDLPSMAGRYENTKEGVRFTPRFPFEGGLTYEAKVSPRVSPGESREIRFRLPKSSKSTPRVEAILPLADKLPENILRFYIQFSEPMTEGESLQHVRLWDDTSGEELTAVFFDHVHELWSSDRRQITLLVDPGRVKTGLVANQKLGRAFQRDHVYRLVVESSWPDMRGTHLGGRYEKRFRSIAADNKEVDASKWSVGVVDAREHSHGGRPKLLVNFRKDVDHVSVRNYLSIRDPDGHEVTGRWDLEECVASFRPDTPWSFGTHQLVANARFEDVVGNNLNGSFDHKVGTLYSEQEGWLYFRSFRITGDLR